MIPGHRHQTGGRGRTPPTGEAPKQGPHRQEGEEARGAQGGPPPRQGRGRLARARRPRPQPRRRGATRRPDPEREGERGEQNKIEAYPHFH